VLVETTNEYRDVTDGEPSTSCRVHIVGTWITSVSLVSSRLVSSRTWHDPLSSTSESIHLLSSRDYPSIISHTRSTRLAAVQLIPQTICYSLNWRPREVKVGNVIRTRQTLEHLLQKLKEVRFRLSFRNNGMTWKKFKKQMTSRNNEK